MRDVREHGLCRGGADEVKGKPCYWFGRRGRDRLLGSRADSRVSDISLTGLREELQQASGGSPPIRASRADYADLIANSPAAFLPWTELPGRLSTAPSQADLPGQPPRSGPSASGGLQSPGGRRALAGTGCSMRNRAGTAG